MILAYFIAIGKLEVLAIPAGLLALYAALFHTKQTLLFIAAITPLSLNLESISGFGGIGFYLPTEPLLAVLLVLFFIWSLAKNALDAKLVKDSFTVLVIAHLLWIFITACSSSIPLVSFKFLISRLWFVVPLYLMAASYFQKKEYLKRYFWGYIAVMCVVICLTIIQHASFGFSEQAGHYVMSPYFKDHTSYGAMIAMFIPFIIGSLSKKNVSITHRVLMSVVMFIFTVGLIFSYTRAAWLSLVGALGVYIIMKLRIKFWIVFSVIATLTIGFFVLQDDIVRELERNRQDSSESFTEHIQSMTNISTDASNLERLNRWNCAVRMFKERPVMGWGPGTYMFQYAPFQKSSELTIISTNLGNAGNAHSEYLGPMAESGLMGGVLFVLILIFILRRGIILYYKLEDPEMKMLTMSFTLGLITYFAHGVLNNFLDTDKASVPFWGFCAAIIAIDLYHKKRMDSKAISS